MLYLLEVLLYLLEVLYEFVEIAFGIGLPGYIVRAVRNLVLLFQWRLLGSHDQLQHLLHWHHFVLHRFDEEDGVLYRCDSLVGGPEVAMQKLHKR